MRLPDRLPDAVRRQRAFTIVVAGVLAGLVVAALRSPLRGALIIGVSFVLGGLLRSVLTERDAGSLATRARTTDAAVLGVLGLVLMFLALSLAASGRG